MHARRLDVDVVIEGHGSIARFTPVTAGARTWFAEHVASEPWQWSGDTLAVERRYADAIVEGLTDGGFSYAQP